MAKKTLKTQIVELHEHYDDVLDTLISNLEAFRANGVYRQELIKRLSERLSWANKKYGNWEVGKYTKLTEEMMEEILDAIIYGVHERADRDTES